MSTIECPGEIKQWWTSDNLESMPTLRLDAFLCCILVKSRSGVFEKKISVHKSYNFEIYEKFVELSK